MAIKKIEMRPEGVNDYADVLYPKTSIDIVDGYGHYSVASGTNSYITSIESITSLVPGTKAVVKFTNASTGATSINISGLGVKSITKPGGGSPNIKANGVYTLIYDGTSFQLQGEGGEYGTALASDVLSGKTVGTDSGLITGTIPSKGAATITPTTANQTIGAGQYLSGTQTIAGVSVPVANVLAGTKIAGATGTMVNRGTYNATATTQGGKIAIPVGYHNGAGGITASFANLVAGNVKKGVNVGGVVGNYDGLELPNTAGVPVAGGFPNHIAIVLTAPSSGYLETRSTSFAEVWKVQRINFPGYYRFILNMKPVYRGYVRVRKNGVVAYTSIELSKDTMLNVDLHFSVGDTLAIDMRSTNGADMRMAISVGTATTGFITP